MRIQDSGFRIQGKAATQRGFTLVELLVAMTVLLILATLTFTMVNVTMKGDQVRSGARQVQSFLEGARDRAIYANEARGVRFLVDQTNPNVVTSMIYIGAPTRYNEGQFAIAADRRTLAIDPANPTDWDEMAERGLISNGQPIEIAGNFYTIIKVHYPTASDPEVWRLTRDFEGSGVGPWTINGPMGGYKLQLNSSILPNAEPRMLPNGIQIDLRLSYLYDKLPSFWYTINSNGGTPDVTTSPTALAASRADDTVTFLPRMEVLFSPRGTITGLLASAGNVHLVLADIRDIEAQRGFFDVDGSDSNTTLDEHETNVREKNIITLTTQTGRVSVHPVFLDNNNDPFRYAELGGEAK